MRKASKNSSTKSLKVTPKSTPKSTTPKAKSLTSPVKPSDLKKDRQDTIRMNTFVKEALAKKGLSLQKLLDDAIDEKLKVDFKFGLI